MDHLTVDKTSLRVLRGTVVVCGEFLVISGFASVFWPDSSGVHEPEM
jgi:hypothetical protein